MKMRAQGIELIAHFEAAVKDLMVAGFVRKGHDKIPEKFLKAHDDGLNIPTIGFGRIRGVKWGDQITEGQAWKNLNQDLVPHERAILRVFNGQEMAQNQFDALVSMNFNAGFVTKGTDAIRDGHLQAGRWIEAWSSLRLWRGGTNRLTGQFQVLPGLLWRRQAEMELFFDGKVPAELSWGTELGKMAVAKGMVRAADDRVSNATMVGWGEAQAAVTPKVGVLAMINVGSGMQIQMLNAPGGRPSTYAKQPHGRYVYVTDNYGGWCQVTERKHGIGLGWLESQWLMPQTASDDEKRDPPPSDSDEAQSETTRGWP